MSSSPSKFLKRLREKVIVADGAMGTTIQGKLLTPDDFDGLDGCNEILVATRPEVIKEIHAAFFEVGADLVETNTFGGATFVLEEYGIGARAYELSRKAAELAVEVANDFTQQSWPRFVAGSVGPTTKLPTLGHITFDLMHAAFLPHMQGLLDGGVDLIQLETCQDILQIKAALLAARDAMRVANREVPICVTVTIETTGTMLLGTEIAAALNVLESLPVNVVGLNCATGPDMMQENVRFLCGTSSRPVAILPNAGLPRNDNGRAVYDLTAEDLADYHELFVKDFGVSFVGGCCGTTPQHIKAVYDRVGSLEPKFVPNRIEPQVSSIYSAVPLDQPGSSPLIIGERCNANGSKRFKELLLEENWEAIVEMGRDEAGSGAHVLDICTAYVGRDETRDMREVLTRFATQVTAPLMIDSTQLDVMEASLKLLGGRSIINSINLEDGEEKFDAICRLAVRYGAALVALTIDEEGMAKGADRKLAVAQRIFDLCTKRHGLPPECLIFDPLTFTIASGDEDSRKAGIDTLRGIELIKKALPQCRTVLGLSNISFGLKPHPRQIVNSVYLSEAIKAGLDACIVHQGKILPLHKIDPKVLQITQDLIYDRRREGYDPLFELINLLQASGAQPEQTADEETLTIEEALRKRIVDGRKIGIDKLLAKAMESYPPLQIINQILLEGMKTVGDLFGRGEMQLPFVLQSAETMKAAVAVLEPHMDKLGGPAKGCMVIATVKGDVHDIGKNLVDIILSNNGYKVVNLGIKQTIDAILASTEEHKPTAVGMSGLLVKSTLVMKENLEEMSRRGWNVAVVCGGAALNRSYVEVDLRKAYSTGRVFYGADAFTGLRIMDELTGNAPQQMLTAEPDEARVRHGEMRAEREARLSEQSKEYVDTKLAPARIIPDPPFWGTRYVDKKEISFKELFTYINKKALFGNQWQYRRGKRSSVEFREFLKDYVEPLFQTWCTRAEERQWLDPKVAYGYFPCNSEKNDLIIFSPDDHSKEMSRISFPRQVADRRRCISDYFLPLSAGRRDVVAFHVVTAGGIATEKCQELFKDDLYTDYLHFYGLSVESAEALAEFWHRRVRHELGIAGQDGPTIDTLFHQSYQGERYSFGYPACPNLEDQTHVFKLLEPEKIGVSLSSEYQLDPEQSTSAIIVHHPEACYYSI